MFTVTFPVDTGTKVETPNGLIGEISCYQCVDDMGNNDDYIVMVTGIKEPWCGEYLLSELKIV